MSKIIENITDNFEEAGWDALVQNTMPMQEDPRAVEIEDAMARLFSTHDGKIVLDWMVSQTIERAAWDPTKSLLESVPLAFSREGQNGFVASILGKIAKSTMRGLPDADQKANRKKRR